MFLGREKELAELERAYATNTFSFAVVYGRRRVGKSTLLNQFAHNKRTVFFTALETDSQGNLSGAGRALSGITDIPQGTFFSSWNAFFDYVAETAKKEQLVFIIDEYPYLARAERGISSLLQQYCDTRFKTSRLMLILCGSSMSFMENQVLGYKSPLYGRRTLQFHIHPFDYYDSAKFVPSYSFEDKALTYACTGGIPKYLELFKDSLTVKQNILNNFFNSSGYLYEEPQNLLKQELREPSKYNAVIEAIVNGCSRLNETATKLSLDTGAVSLYLRSLITLGIVEKVTPVTENANKKKTLYRVCDGMFNFWYRYVFGNDFSLVSGTVENLYDNEIQSDLPRFMGSVFEKMCREYLIRKAVSLPFPVRELGCWWGTNQKSRTEEEIDIVAVNTKLSAVLFGECKYRDRQTDMQVYENLVERSQLLPSFKEKYYMLFSKSGFTGTLKKRAAEDTSLQLVTIQDMYTD